MATSAARELFFGAAPCEFKAAFDTVARERIGALLILADPLFFANSKQLAELSIKSP
jgi:hypothetical protein